MGMSSIEGNVIGLGTPVNDAFGSKTAAAGTAITRVIPGRLNTRARAAGFSYLPGANAHILSFLTVLDEVFAMSDAAAAQGVISLSELPTNIDGTALETADWFCIQHEDGTWGEYNFGSASGLSVTISPVLTKKVLKNGRICYMGKPADHADRQYQIPATNRLTLGGDDRSVIATAAKNGEPILAHSNNVTAAGSLDWLSYVYDPQA